MKYNKLTFGDIMQRKILFYDADVIEACENICSVLHIDNLPDMDGRNYHELSGKDFNIKRVGDELRLLTDDRIFEMHLLEKFSYNRHNVLFVYEGEVLMGIVHISDYNHDIVIQAIQDDILVFERNLRQWLILQGYNNNDVIEFFKTKGSKSEGKFWRKKFEMAVNKKNEMSEFGEFQLFDFSDLLHFLYNLKSTQCIHLKSIKINDMNTSGIEVLTSLRNLAMHGKNPVTYENDSEIFSIASLRQLFEKLEFLKTQYHKLSVSIRNHEDYINSIRIDNKNKLNIIHRDHPKAIWYFIGR